MSATVSFPRIRLQEFNEHRIRTPIRGGLIDEHADSLITEPLANQLSRWLSDSDHLYLDILPHHSSVDLSGGVKAISICYVLKVASKGEIVQLAYGR